MKEILASKVASTQTPEHQNIIFVFMLIFLVGFMGSGKTYVGRQLARMLKFQFLDLDEWIERQTGKTIQQLFEVEGEEDFRWQEAALLRATIHLENYVIATGGGAPCFHQNMEWMNEHGLTVFLHASPELLALCLEKETNHRPLLREKSGIELRNFIEKTLRQRAEFYEQAHLSIEIQSHGQEVAEELASFLVRFVKT